MRLRPDLPRVDARSKDGASGTRVPDEKRPAPSEEPAGSGFEGSRTGITELRSAQLLQGVEAPVAGSSSVFQLQLSGGAKPILPKPGVPYTARVERMGKSVPFEVTFSLSACSALWARGLRVDLEHGTLVGAGAPLLLGDGAELAARHGGEPRAWVWLDHDTDLFMAPSGSVLIDIDADGQLQFASGAYKPVFVDVFRDRLSRADGGPQRVARGAPVTSESFTVTKPLGEAITLTATSEDAAADAQRAFDAVCGRAMARWPERRQALEAQAAVFTRAIRPLVEVCTALEEGEALPVHTDDTLARARALCGLDDSHAPIALLRALDALRARLRETLMPVEVAVVPRGSHLLDMPHFDPLRAGPGWVNIEEKFKSAELSFVTLVGRRVVFLSEEDLAAPTQGFSRHELYHLLESVLLDDSVVARVDAIHARLTEQGGPFTRAYGVTRSEFFTTCGEELEGLWGADGAAWLANRIPDMLALLRDVTGRA